MSDLTRTQRATYLVPVLLGTTTLLVAGGLAWYLVAQGRGLDFQEFLLNRREGLGQTTPDRSARCQYALAEKTLNVTRVAHGQTEQHSIELPGASVEGFFGGQQALIETTSTAETYDCTNGEHLSHPLDADSGNPISRVLFSTSGRNVALVLNVDTHEGSVEVLKFKVDAGQASWNEHFGDGEHGLRGSVKFARLVGESLLVVLDHGKKVELHTYNFRAGQKANPWNANSRDAAAHGSLVAAGLVGAPEFLERGKQVDATVRVSKGTRSYSYDFTCKLQTPAGASENPKPCGWR